MQYQVLVMLVTVYSERSKTTDEQGRFPCSFFFAASKQGRGRINIHRIYNISCIHITYNIEVLRLRNTILWKKSVISRKYNSDKLVNISFYYKEKTVRNCIYVTSIQKGNVFIFGRKCLILKFLDFLRFLVDTVNTLLYANNGDRWQGFQ